MRIAPPAVNHRSVAASYHNVGPNAVRTVSACCTSDLKGVLGFQQDSAPEHTALRQLSFL